MRAFPRRILSLLLLLLLPAVAVGQTVVFRSGEPYRIESAGMGKGGVVPGEVVGNPAVLLYVPGEDQSDAFQWTIAEDGKTDEKGRRTYTFCHTTTRQYATFDGLRDDNKRYVGLTPTPEGDASRWIIVDRGGAWSIENVKAPEHHWHVRSSYLVGTYADESTPSRNSLFHLVGNDGQQVTDMTEPAPSFARLIGSLKIGGKTPVYDKTTNTYLATISAEQSTGRSLKAAVEYDATAGELEIDDITATNGATHTFSDYAGGRVFRLFLRTNASDVEGYGAFVTFTQLPVVELFGTGFSASYQPGKIRVNDPETAGDDEILNMRTHWRGNTSIRRAKKNYAVKLTDADGVSIDRKLLGLRSDNNWVLDAAMIDPSRVRNRVSTDLWNDFRTDPYYAENEKKVRTGTRGRMVEVFLNGSYEGVYCMTEKLDRKQFKLKKLQTVDADGFAIDDPEQHGIIYKAVEWDYTSYFGYDGEGFPGLQPAEPSNASDAWGGWEIKYPDLGDGDPIDWAPLYDHVAFVATCSDKAFEREVDDRFDLPVLLDYYLLQEMAMAFDNSAKNIYWFIYDAAESTRLSLAPWDFDGTWGRIWNGTRGNSYPETTLRDSSKGHLSINKVYSLLMRLDHDGWNKRLAQRYAELRRSGIFSTEALYARFTDYIGQMQRSGATQREHERWDGVEGFCIDWDEELAYLREWIDTHVATLDAFYGYDPITSVQNRPLSYRSGKGTIDVYSPDGRKLTSIRAYSGREADAALRSLPPGVYIIGGRKVKI